MKKIDISKFIGYLVRFPVVAVRKRAGYLLEELKLPDLYLNRIKSHLGGSATFDVLDPARPRSGKMNKDWGIIVNR